MPATDYTPMTTAVYATLAYLTVEAAYLADNGQSDRIDKVAAALAAGDKVPASNPVRRVVRRASAHLLRPARQGDHLPALTNTP